MKYLLYNKLARYYDLIYSTKNYKGESEYQIGLIRKYQKLKGNDLLEVACGTGRYLEFYETEFTCTGVDLNSEMLKLAKKRVKNSKLLTADMLSLKLKKQFDVVTCLFSSIGYVHGYRNLEKVIQNFADHLKPGGVVLISPWLRKEQYMVGSPHLEVYDSPDLKIARASASFFKKPNISVKKFHWMVAEKNKEVVHIDNDVHELAMYSEKEFLAAFKKAGLKGEFVSRDKDSRGLYVAVK